MARKSGPDILVEMHVVVDETISVREGHDIADEVEQTLMARMTKVNKVIVHVDPDTGNGLTR
jgi:divalent metal cation (Fe/Co/Zn/Cd) transporter